MYKCSTTETRPQTFGPGIEREVIYMAFNRYLKSFGTWFCPRFDERASLQTTCGIWRAMTGAVSENRIQSMKQLGAICALMLIHGMCPEPLNPLIFHFIINNCDFNCLHQGLVQEWHPTLYSHLKSWVDTGSGGSLEPFRAHFASYHDMDVCFFFYSVDSSLLNLSTRFLSFVIVIMPHIWLWHPKFCTMQFLVLSLLFIRNGKPSLRDLH